MKHQNLVIINLSNGGNRLKANLALVWSLLESNILENLIYLNGGENRLQ